MLLLLPLMPTALINEHRNRCWGNVIIMSALTKTYCHCIELLSLSLLSVFHGYDF